MATLTHLCAEEGTDINRSVSSPNLYNFETVVVEGEKSDFALTGETITQDEMERDNVRNLWDAMRYTPGVILSGGGRRNDSSFSIRGFGADSVPVFVDGVIMANPYKGGGDAARTLTGDLESLTIQKGYSSRLLGANTLGGAVLMTTAKPKKAFEARLDATRGYDRIYEKSADNYLASLGTKQELFYFKGTYQQRDVDHFRLSKDFEPTSVNPQQPGERLFSDTFDQKYTLVAGLTPNKKLDIWATYILQDSDKGVSPPETTIQDYVIWDWIKWRREGVSLAADYDDGQLELKTLLHADRYDNALNEYWSLPSYKVGVHDPTSVYDESTKGGRITAGWRFNEAHKIQAAATFKREEHIGLTNNKRINYILEDTISAGAEYTAVLFPGTKLVGGIGYDALQPREYWDKQNDFAALIGSEYYVVKPKAHWLIAGQLGLYYDLAKDHEMRLTYARKNRFPTMSERYSTRYGRTLPNPLLQPEVADHFELGYKGRWGNTRINTAVYYSSLVNKIVTLGVPNPEYPTIPVDFYLNLDQVGFYGYELGVESWMGSYLSGGIACSLNQYDISDGADQTAKAISYYPEVTANAYLVIAPSERVSIIPRVEYIDSRYTDISANEELEAYTLAHLKATYDVSDFFSVSAKVSNIFDEYYEIRQFYPQAGRSFSLTLSARY